MDTKRLFAFARLEEVARQCHELIFGDPQGDMRRRLTTGCARCYVLKTDRPSSVRQILYDLTEPLKESDVHRWHSPYCWRLPDNRNVEKYAGRKSVLARIAQGGLEIDEELGQWNGSFWHGLRLSGALRQGPGTELRLWERLHGDLIADITEMPLMHRLEPRTAMHGQRRLRRCYAAYLPPEQSTERSVLAGLFAGSVLRDADGETWMELADHNEVRNALNDWGIPFRSHAHTKGKMVIWVSPLFGQLVMHLMPKHSAARFISIKQAGGCPMLPAIMWKMAMNRRGRRRKPFKGALPFAISRATHFRRGLHELDLHKIGWLDYGIRITPKLRDLLEDWLRRKTAERQSLPQTSTAA